MPAKGPWDAWQYLRYFETFEECIGCSKVGNERALCCDGTVSLISCGLKVLALSCPMCNTVLGLALGFAVLQLPDPPFWALTDRKRVAR